MIYVEVNVSLKATVKKSVNNQGEERVKPTPLHVKKKKKLHPNVTHRLFTFNPQVTDVNGLNSRQLPFLQTLSLASSLSSEQTPLLLAQAILLCYSLINSPLYGIQPTKRWFDPLCVASTLRLQKRGRARPKDVTSDG